MKHASLFSGIGGFDLAAEWAGWENIFHCEWNPFGQKVLKHHFPNSISYNDITKTDFSIHSGQIDVLTGGFPCQPYSQAGKRLGKADERHLFPEMLRCIKEVKPRWIIGENVRGLVSWNEGLVFNEVYDDLEREGYEVQSFLIPAASVNAPHQRYRIWFVAYNASNTISFRRGENVRVANGKSNVVDENGEARDFTNTNKIGFSTEMENRKLGGEFGFAKCDKRNPWNTFPTVTPICGGDDGLPKELDSITISKWRKESIMAYGNAIVPQVAYQIFQAINEFEMQNM
jgi:DNA (cytosine-5)-methyltransferase 1